MIATIADVYVFASIAMEQGSVLLEFVTITEGACYVIESHCANI